MEGRSRESLMPLFGENHDEAPPKRRRFDSTHSNAKMLPPIETLRAEDLKLFTREELATYLQDQGIYATADETKPSLKQRLRVVLSELERKRALGASGSLDLSVVPLGEKRRSLSSGMFGEEASSSEGGRVCEDCRSKKANKDCLYNRCKACCNHRGFNCTIHFLYARSNSRGATASPPFVGFPPGFSTPSPAGRYNQGAVVPPGGPQQASFWQQHVQVLSQQGIKPGAVPLNMPPSFQPAFLKHMQMLQRTIRCPSCSQFVSRIGASFFLHFSKCNPDYFFYWVQNGQTIEDLIPPEHREDTPVNKARQEASDRRKWANEFMTELFSTTSVDSIEESVGPPVQLDSQMIECRMDDLVKYADDLVTRHEAFGKEFQRKSELFMQRMSALKQCATLEEIENCKKDFEADFGVTLDSPTLFKEIPRLPKQKESSKMVIVNL